jgi:hypothetical protein
MKGWQYMNYQEGQKIQALYNKRTDINYRSSAEAIEQTTNILTSGGIGSAWVYTGTHTEDIIIIGGMLALRPNTEKEVFALVYVDGLDEYHVDYVEIINDRAEYISRHPGVFVGELARVYEEIYDRYINEYQDGFIKC